MDDGSDLRLQISVHQREAEAMNTREGVRLTHQAMRLERERQRQLKEYTRRLNVMKKPSQSSSKLAPPPPPLPLPTTTR